MNQLEIKRILDSDSGKALKDYLVERLNELRMIDSIKILDTPTHQTIELKAQKKAYDKLKDILGELITIESFDDSKKELDDYNVM